MKKSIHSPEYQLVLAKLVAMREQAGLTQRELAKKLDREHSFVWRIETGERRLDVVEFHWVCNALNQKAERVYEDLVIAFGKTPTMTVRERLVAENKVTYRVKPK